MQKFKLITIGGIKHFVVREPVDWIPVTFDLTIYIAVGGMVYCALWLMFHVTSAKAQDGLMTLCGETYCEYDWPKIQECARRSIKGPDYSKLGDLGMMSPEWQRYDLDFRTIKYCRDILSARHAGWSTATDKPDPIPPEPMMRKEDMK